MINVMPSGPTLYEANTGIQILLILYDLKYKGHIQFFTRI